MNRYAIAPHVRICLAITDTVGIDLQRNRYFALGARETAALHHHGLLMAHDMERPSLDESQIAPVTESLVHAGLLISTNAHLPALSIDSHHEPRKPRMAPPGASAGYEYNDALPVRAHHLATLLRAWQWARARLRTHSLLAISQCVEHSRSSTEMPLDRSLSIALVGTFRLLRPFVYCAREQCLLHALTLARFLAHYHQHPHWVIGVRTRPWAAHSWLQWDELIFDGRPDDVGEYTPLLVC